MPYSQQYYKAEFIELTGEKNDRRLSTGFKG